MPSDLKMSSSGYDSDTETLFEEPISKFNFFKLGPRGHEWRDKLLNGIASRTKIVKLKAKALSKEEIVDVEPGYYYDADYHDLTGLEWFRRNKSVADLSSAVGTAAGYSAWEYCGAPCHTRDDSCRIN
jgi:hypothetical protein